MRRVAQCGGTTVGRAVSLLLLLCYSSGVVAKIYDLMSNDDHKRGCLPGLGIGSGAECTEAARALGLFGNGFDYAVFSSGRCDNSSVTAIGPVESKQECAAAGRRLGVSDADGAASAIDVSTKPAGCYIKTNFAGDQSSLWFNSQAGSTAQAGPTRQQICRVPPTASELAPAAGEPRGCLYVAGADADGPGSHGVLFGSQSSVVGTGAQAVCRLGPIGGSAFCPSSDFFCGGDTRSGWCGYTVPDQAQAAGLSCDQYCELRSATCVQAWRTDVEQRCHRKFEVQCDQLIVSGLTCQCEVDPPEFEAPVWISRDPAWGWVEAETACANLGQRLALFDEYCPGWAKAETVFGSSRPDGPQWAPYSGEGPDGWLQIADYPVTSRGNGIRCKRYHVWSSQRPQWLNSSQVGSTSNSTKLWVLCSTVPPTESPTTSPTLGPSWSPTTSAPTHGPSAGPSRQPSSSPTTSVPSPSPTTSGPSTQPTAAPTAPTAAPTEAPTKLPSASMPRLSVEANGTSTPMATLDDAEESRSGQSTAAIVAVVVILLILFGCCTIAAIAIWKRSLRDAEVQQAASRRAQIEHSTLGVAETQFNAATGPVPVSSLARVGSRSASFKIPPPPPGLPPVQHRSKKGSGQTAYSRDTVFTGDKPQSSSAGSISSTQSDRSTAYIYKASDGQEVMYTLAAATDHAMAVQEGGNEFSAIGAALANAAEDSPGAIPEARPTARVKPAPRIDLQVPHGRRESTTDSPSVSFDSPSLDVDTDVATIMIDVGASSADIDTDVTGVVTIGSEGHVEDTATDEMLLTTGGLRPGDFDT